MEPVVRAAVEGGVKLVENNELCLAVLANFQSSSAHCALAATGRNSRKANQWIATLLADRVGQAP